MNAPWSGRFSLAFGTRPLKPHGNWLISSEWASTLTVTVRARLESLLSFSPNSAARWLSDA